MKVIISNYNYYHTPYQVKALTPYVKDVDIIYYSAVNPFRLKQVCNSFPSKNMKNFFWRYAFGKCIDKYFFKRNNFSKRYEENYSKVIGKLLRMERERYIFHSFNGCALNGILQTKKNNSVSIVESGVHPRFYAKIQTEEFEKYNVKAFGISDKYIENTERELNECDYILTISEICKRSFLLEGLENKKIVQIPISVDTSLFYRTKEREKRFVILYVGRITIMKGVQYLFDAYDLLRSSEYDVEFRLAGTITDAPMAEICKRYAEDKNVKFMGQCSIERLREEYSSASVMVMPSLVDSFCMAIFESFACKTPVISTENVGAPIHDAMDGYVVPIRSAESIADKIAYLYDNKDLIECFGNNGYDSISNYTWHDYAEKLMEFYTEIY